ncbi:MAG: hypothetical protein WHV26_12970 [Spirochaetota bacterium]
MYAIHKFLLDTMKQKNLSKKDVALRLGYKNISKGIRRIDEFIQEGTLNENIIKNLHIALDESVSKVLEKLEETKQQIAEEIKKQEEEKIRVKEEKRKNFKPFLYCVTEQKIPQPIFVAAISESYLLKKVSLPDNFNELSPKQKLDAMRNAISQHYEYIHNRWGGIVPAYGKILAYTLVPTFEYNEEDLPVYTPQGELIEQPPRFYQEIELGVAGVSIGKKIDLTKIFKNVEMIVEKIGG